MYTVHHSLYSDLNPSYIIYSQGIQSVMSDIPGRPLEQKPKYRRKITLFVK